MTQIGTGGTIGRTLATVTYKDGKTEKLRLAPLTVYETGKLGITDELTAGFVAIWIAAGKPGLNGEPLTGETAVTHMEAWLEDLDAVDTGDEPS